jgi:predicted TIM-barrel fold metal-dependent hydrolase
MRRCVQELGFVGFKLHPWMQGFSLMVPGMEAVAEECADMQVPVTFHDGTAFYCTALQVAYFARAHPRVRVLSAHGGLAEGWVDVITPALELPNYWICLSGPTQQGIQALYDQLGPDKLLFGSDGGWIPSMNVDFHLRQVRALRAPAAHISAILASNALRFLQER